METDGNLQGAAKAWFSAIANDPGKVALHEGLIHLILGQAKPDLRSLTLAVSSAHWLLQLSGTNESTLTLATGVLSKAGLYDEVWDLLNPALQPASPRTDRILAIAAFETDRFELFSKIWSRNEGDFGGDPELRLYHDAWLSLWGPPGSSASALHSVETACQSQNQAASALRLKLIIHSQRLDSDAFEDAFRRLKTLGEARIQDHVRYWLFLTYLGNQERARIAARSADLNPVSVMEASLLIKGWTRLELGDLVAAFARGRLANFPTSPRLHLQVARALLANQRWEDVRFLAALIRTHPRLGASMGGYADFLDGRSSLALGHPAQAREAFQKLAATPPNDPALGLEIAGELIRLGHSDTAIPILRRLERPLSSSTNFWRTFGTAAKATGDEVLLVSAAQRALALSPQDPSLAMDCGFALAVSRRHASEATRVTLEALNRAPRSPLANLCHALALSQTGRFADALQRLQKASPESLPPDLRNQWWLCRFESEVGLGLTEKAQTSVKAIHRPSLFPSQRDWLTKAQSHRTLTSPSP